MEGSFGEELYSDEIAKQIKQIPNNGLLYTFAEAANAVLSCRLPIVELHTVVRIARMVNLNKLDWDAVDRCLGYSYFYSVAKNPVTVELAKRVHEGEAELCGLLADALLDVKADKAAAHMSEGPHWAGCAVLRLLLNDYARITSVSGDSRQVQTDSET